MNFLGEEIRKFMLGICIDFWGRRVLGYGNSWTV